MCRGCATETKPLLSSLERGEKWSRTHGNADVSRRQGRRIIYAVAHVCKRPSMLRPQRANLQSNESTLRTANESMR